MQEVMYSVFLFHKKNKDDKIEEQRFERDLFISNPQMYQEYMKNKEADASNGTTGVEWLAPESAEELDELMDTLADIQKQLDITPEEKAANEEFAQNFNFISLLGGIDVDEIGED